MVSLEFDRRKRSKMADLQYRVRPSGAAGDRERVLFIDSDPILREFAVANLADARTWVDTAADPEVAFAILDVSEPDVVVLDLESRAAGGLELLGRLRNDDRWRSLPVMVVTGRDDAETVERAYDAGATTFVPKPLNWRLLGHQLRFMHRSAECERLAREELAAAADRLTELAAAGAQFVAQAVRREPGLRSAALHFARVAGETLNRAAEVA